MNQEDDILKKELQKLGLFRCPDQIWNDLEHDLEDGLLSSRLNELQIKKVDEALWSGIHSELELQDRVKLKEYQAPDFIWDEVEKQLDRSKNTEIIDLRWALSAAAVLALVFSLWIFRTDDEKIRVSESFVPAQEILDWEEEDREWEMILEEACERQPVACRTERFLDLEKELEFLDHSKEKVLAELNPYEDNSRAEKILTEIELERVEVIKELIKESLS